MPTLSRRRSCFLSVARLALVFTLVAPLAGVLGLAGCSPGGYSGKTEPIAVGVLNEASILNFIAQDRGYFTQNGLNVTLKKYDNGPQAVAGMLKGEVDLCNAGDFVLVGQAFAKQQIQTVGCIDQGDYLAVIGRKDHGIAGVSDLVGKRIGLVRGTATEFFLGRFLLLNKLGAQDVKLVAMDSNTQLVDAVTLGDVDAIITGSPFTEDAATRLGSNAIFWRAQGDQPVYMLLMSSNTWVSQHPAVAQRLLKALAAAEDYVVGHSEEARAIAKKNLNVTDQAISTAWARNQFSLSLDQGLMAALEDQARWEISSNLVSQKEIPDFLSYVYVDTLKAVKPEAVTIIR